MRNILLLLILIVISSYSSIEKSSRITCDAEQVINSKFKGVSSSNRFTSVLFDAAYLKSSEHSKSGKYSVKLTKQNPYGFTYQIKKVKAGEHFRVSTWRYSSNTSGILVVSALNSNDLFVSQNNSNGNTVGQWEELSFEFNVPSTADNQDIKVFVYNVDTVNPIYFDDLFIEYRVVNPSPSNAAVTEFIDKRDNKKYKIVKIGKDWWMAENLNYHLDDSCRCYNDIHENCSKYGRLYTYNAAINACPDGWRLPSDADWKNLERSIGMDENEIEKYGWRGKSEAQKLLEFGSSGFNGYLTGTYDRKFYYQFVSSYYWTSTQIDDSSAWCREISKPLSIGRFKDNKRMLFSVRCILNQE